MTWSVNGIILSQRKYTLDLLKDSGVLGSKPISTPMDPNQKLTIDQGDLLDDPSRYRKLVGKFNYLTITRLDISFAVSVVSQFLKKPRMPHRIAIQLILRYLQGPPGCGLLYKDHGHLCTEAYINANWVGSPSNRRSTTSYCTSHGGNLNMEKYKKSCCCHHQVYYWSKISSYTP